MTCKNCGKNYPRDIYTYPGFCCVLCMTEFKERGGPQVKKAAPEKPTLPPKPDAPKPDAKTKDKPKPPKE